MASSSDVRAGRAFYELGANDSSLQKALNKAANSVKAFGTQLTNLGKGMLAVGAAIQAPLEAAAMLFAEMGEKVAIAAQRTGMTAESISTLGYAASQAGGDVETIEKAIAKMNRTMLEAAQGKGEISEVFETLKLNSEQLQSMAPEARFKAIADSLSKVRDPGERAGLAMKIFGKGAMELLPLINDGAAGIDKLQERARALGLEMSTNDANGARKFAQQLRDMWDVIQRVGFTIGSAVVPALTNFISRVTLGSMMISKWVSGHKQIIQTAYMVAGGIIAAGTAFVVLGTGISVAAGLLAGVATIIGAIGAAVAFVLNPVTLLVGAVLAVAGAFVYWSGIGTQVGNQMMDVFKGVWNTLKFIFDNTSSAGEAWGAIMAEASIYATEAWSMFKAYMGGLWNSITSIVAKSTVAATSIFLSTWAKTMHMYGTIVNKTADWISDTFDKTAEHEDESLRKMADAHLAAGEWTQKQHDDFLSHPIKGQQDKDRAKRDSDLDAELSDKLAGIKAEADAKQAALDAMQAQEGKASQEEIARARAEAEAKRKAYEDALKKQHDASGAKSVSDQFKEFLNLKLPDAPGIPKDIGDQFGFDQQAKGKSAGTFYASAARGMGGGGAMDKVAANTKKTAELNQKQIDLLDKLSKRDPLTFT